MVLIAPSLGGSVGCVIMMIVMFVLWVVLSPVVARMLLVLPAIRMWMLRWLTSVCLVSNLKGLWLISSA